MDATELGIKIFFGILIPGFLFSRGFRVTSGTGGYGSDFAAICYAAICGVFLLTLMGSDSKLVRDIDANPVAGGIALALVGFFIGLLAGIPVGWIRRKIR